LAGCHWQPANLLLARHPTYVSLGGELMRSRLLKSARWLRRRAENLAVAWLSMMFATFILQIFYRYILGDPLPWSEEFIVMSWLWTVLWGAGFILSEAEEIRFDIIYSHISEKTRRIFTVITGVVLVAMYGISLPASYKYVSFMKVERTASLHIPLDWVYSVYIMFAVACIVRYCWLVYHAFRGGKSPETDPAKVGD
jgi:C4-dicarboxylate transporter DctQ subunit